MLGTSTAVLKREAVAFQVAGVSVCEFHTVDFTICSRRASMSTVLRRAQHTYGRAV